MDAKDFARDLRAAVTDLRAKGVESIQSENLIKYLDDTLPNLDTPSAEMSLERYKAELQKWIEEHRNVHAQSVEVFRSVIQAGQNALRTAFVMNGGASVALLAFAAHLVSIHSLRVPAIAPSLAVFVVGVLIAALASGATYLCQWFYADGWRRAGFVCNLVAIFLGLAAYVSFAVGMWRAYRVLATF
jgi:hypothetical protein